MLAIAEPPESTTFPPIPLLEDPTTKLTEPAWEETLFPDPNSKYPDAPFAAVPVAKTSEPEFPDDTADPDTTDTLPLPDRVLDPEDIVTLPPTAAERLLPACNTSDAPWPLPETPTTSEMPPA